LIRSTPNQARTPTSWVADKSTWKVAEERKKEVRKMKRDMDLGRKILFAIEECQDPWGPRDFEIEGYSNQEISYHIKMLCQAGLIEAEDCSSMGPDGYSWDAGPLTWEGHEFLEAARDNNRWEATKKIIREKGGGLVFETLKATLIQAFQTSVLK
jgi:hypothetical protein